MFNAPCCIIAVEEYWLLTDTPQSHVDCHLTHSEEDFPALSFLTFQPYSGPDFLRLSVPLPSASSKQSCTELVVVLGFKLEAWNAEDFVHQLCLLTENLDVRFAPHRNSKP